MAPGGEFPCHADYRSGDGIYLDGHGYCWHNKKCTIQGNCGPAEPETGVDLPL